MESAMLGALCSSLLDSDYSEMRRLHSTNAGDTNCVNDVKHGPGMEAWRWLVSEARDGSL